MKIPTTNKYLYTYNEVSPGIVFQFCDEPNKYYMAGCRIDENENKTYDGHIDLATGQFYYYRDNYKELYSKEVRVFENAELFLGSGEED